MIENLSVLVVDNSFAVVDTAFTALQKSGFSRSKMHSTKSFKDAVDFIKNKKPDFLITDYFIDGRSGLELIALLTEQSADKMTMVITHNNSSSAIAEAAEELVDDYLIKPFLPTMLTERIQNLVKRKLTPPQYLAEIRKGKQLLLQSQFQAANTHFKNASFLDPKPTLAHYYLGHAHYLQKQFEDAILGYKAGLEFRPLHFKCLTGQFDAYFEQKRFQDAYKLVPELTQHYPIGPRRLCNLFVAAVYSGRMEDVPGYYDLFLKLHHVTPELRRIFSAALFVAGRFHMTRNSMDKALSCFDCGLQVIGADLSYIDKVVRTLVSAGISASEHAAQYLRKFPSEYVGGAEYSALLYLVDQYRKTPAQLIEQGRSLVQKNFADADCFRILIKSLLAEERTTLAEDYITRAVRLFPGLRKEFIVSENL